MKEEIAYLTDWSKIWQISFGLVYVLFNVWVIFHIPEYFPEGSHEVWYKVFISYGLLNAWIFSNEDMRNMLFDVNFWKFIPRVIVSFVISLVLYFFILQFIDPLGHTFFDLLANVPLWLALVHGITFATTESLVFQGYLDKKIGAPSALVAGIFHYGVWSGGALIVVFTATVLFLFFNIINRRFRKSENDLSAVIGNHTAFNFVKLGIHVLGG